MYLYDTSYFGTTLKQLREFVGLTQADVYNTIGISEDTLRRIENGQTIPKIETLCYLSLTYKTNIIGYLNENSIFNTLADSRFAEELNQMIIKNEFDSIDSTIGEIETFIEKLSQMSTDKLILNRLMLFKNFAIITKEHKQQAVTVEDLSKIREKILRSLTAANPKFSLSAKAQWNLSPIEIRFLLLYSELLRIDDFEEDALELLNTLHEISEKKQHYDPTFKEITLKIDFNRAYCYHKLDKHHEVVALCNQSQAQCVHYNCYTLMHLFLYRKAVAYYHLGDPDLSKTTFNDCLTFLNLTGQSEISIHYTKQYEKLLKKMQNKTQ